MEIENTRIKDGNKFSYHVLLGFGLLSIVVGFILTPSIKEVMDGLVKIIYAHHRIDSELITVAGSYGAGFVNAGLMIIAVWAVYKLCKTQIKGLEWAAAGQIFGYAFYAESLFNVWPTIIGVLLEAKINKRNMGEQAFAAWFSTALAPFVSTFAFHVDAGFLKPGSPISILVGVLLGVGMGYLVGKAAPYVKTLHKGRLLFNLGFTTGIVGWFTYNFLKAAGLAQVPVEDQVYIANKNGLMFALFMIFNLYFFISGMIYNGGLGDYFKKMFWARTDGGNYVDQFGIGNALMNMGVVGTAALLYTIVTPGAQLNGPVIGGAFTVAGFGAFGMTIRSIVPIWFGIWIGSFLFGGLAGYFGGQAFLASGILRMGHRSMSVAAMHCCGSAPTGERDGWWVSTMVGVIHTTNVVNTGALSGWMQSYNNGFSQGLIFTVFQPFWGHFSKIRKESKEVSI